MGVNRFGGERERTGVSILVIDSFNLKGAFGVLTSSGIILLDLGVLAGVEFNSSSSNNPELDLLPTRFLETLLPFLLGDLTD